MNITAQSLALLEGESRQDAESLLTISRPPYRFIPNCNFIDGKVVDLNRDGQRAVIRSHLAAIVRDGLNKQTNNQQMIKAITNDLTLVVRDSFLNADAEGSK